MKEKRWEERRNAHLERFRDRLRLETRAKVGVDGETEDLNMVFEEDEMELRRVLRAQAVAAIFFLRFFFCSPSLSLSKSALAVVFSRVRL